MIRKDIQESRNGIVSGKPCSKQLSQNCAEIGCVFINSGHVLMPMPIIKVWPEINVAVLSNRNGYLRFFPPPVAAAVS